MKTGLSMFLCLALLVFTSPMLEAGVVGDINNDEKVGLPEAINALQVTAGLKAQETLGITPDLVGTWELTSPMECFTYENYILPNQLPVHATTTGVSMTITTQNGKVFAGYLVGPDHDPDEPPTYLTGIIEHNRIIIQMAADDVWHRIHCVLFVTDGKQKMVGTFEEFENQATASSPGILSCTFEVVKK